ncbi:MAG: hypothetical protein RLY87_1689 [Chloroflexota bacterium]|jgi:hypothetical protein
MPTVYGLHLRATCTSPLLRVLRFVASLRDRHSSASLRDRPSDTPLSAYTP